jgi:cytoskeletal protein RodZ
MVGDILRAAREKKGLTFKDVENETSIRSLYIESIEKGDYGALPGAVYTKGFIRNYATMLGLDSDAVLKQYYDETNTAAAVPAGPEAEEDGKDAPADPPFQSGMDFHDRVEKSHRSQNILVVVGVIALAVVGSVYYFFGSDETASTVKPGVVQTQEKAQPAPLETKPVVPIDGVEVAAKFSARCWTQVAADGKTIYEGTAEKGQTFTWKGKDRVVVTAGNAGAVELTWNGKDQGKLGHDGDVVEKRFTKDKAEEIK